MLCGTSHARPLVRPVISLCTAFLALIVGCSDAVAPGVPNASATHPSDLRPEWVPTSPDQEGVDSAALAAAFDRGGTVPGLTSVVVIRHSRLVGERYYQIGGRDSLYSIRSVTKSVMSLLLGAAIDREVFRDVHATLAQVLVPRPPALNAAKGAITLEDILTMSSGFQWNESGVTEYNNWVTSPDEVGYLLARPIVNSPGADFNYNSAAVHLLAVALSDATGGHMREFADSVLFAPLGISHDHWEVFPDSVPNGGAGLYIRSRDMAKIGALVLQVGMSGTRPIVSRDWIRTVVEGHITAFGSANGPAPIGYGYLWWLPTVGSHHYIMAEGYGGQFILIVPDLDAVVVATATWQSVGAAAPADYFAIEQFLMGGVVPTIRPGV
jgi:CubicO group peptidase (beta-lactamase class C family)